MDNELKIVIKPDQKSFDDLDKELLAIEKRTEELVKKIKKFGVETAPAFKAGTKNVRDLDTVYKELNERIDVVSQKMIHKYSAAIDLTTGKFWENTQSVNKNMAAAHELRKENELLTKTVTELSKKIDLIQKAEGKATSGFKEMDRQFKSTKDKAFDLEFEILELQHTLEKMGNSYDKTLKKVDKFDRKLEASGKNIGETTKKTKFMDSAFVKFGVTMSGIAATIFVFEQVFTTLKNLADISIRFESDFTKMAYSFNVTTEEILKLETAINKVLMSTGHASKNSIQAMKALLEEGYSADKAIGLLAKTLGYAANETIDFKKAAKLAGMELGGIETQLLRVDKAMENTAERKIEAMKNALKELVKQFGVSFGDDTVELVRKLSTVIDKEGAQSIKNFGKMFTFIPKLFINFIEAPIMEFLEKLPIRIEKALIAIRNIDWKGILTGALDIISNENLKKTIINPVLNATSNENLKKVFKPITDATSNENLKKSIINPVLNTTSNENLKKVFKPITDAISNESLKKSIINPVLDATSNQALKGYLEKTFDKISEFRESMVNKTMQSEFMARKPRDDTESILNLFSPITNKIKDILTGPEKVSVEKISAKNESMEINKPISEKEKKINALNDQLNAIDKKYQKSQEFVDSLLGYGEGFNKFTGNITNGQKDVITGQDGVIISVADTTTAIENLKKLEAKTFALTKSQVAQRMIALKKEHEKIDQNAAGEVSIAITKYEKISNIQENAIAQHNKILTEQRKIWENQKKSEITLTSQKFEKDILALSANLDLQEKMKTEKINAIAKIEDKYRDIESNAKADIIAKDNARNQAYLDAKEVAYKEHTIKLTELFENFTDKRIKTSKLFFKISIDNLKKDRDQQKKYYDFAIKDKKTSEEAKLLVDKWYAEKYNELILDLNKEHSVFGGFRSGLYKLTQEYTTWGQNLEDITTSVAINSRNSLKDSFLDLIKNDMDDFGNVWDRLWQSMLDTVNDKVAEMAANAVLNMVVNTTFQGLNGLMGMNGMMGGLMGGGYGGGGMGQMAGMAGTAAGLGGSLFSGGGAATSAAQSAKLLAEAQSAGISTATTGTGLFSGAGSWFSGMGGLGGLAGAAALPLAYYGMTGNQGLEKAWLGPVGAAWAVAESMGLVSPDAWEDTVNWSEDAWDKVEDTMDDVEDWAEDTWDKIEDWFAGGGRAKRNKSYIVGEEGPELFVPDQDGQVYSNSDSKNMMSKLGQSSNGQYIDPAETHIHLEIDGREIAHVISKQIAQGNYELINKLRGI